MRVTTGYNPYPFRQQNSKATGTGFAELLANRAAKSNPAPTGMGVTATEENGLLHMMSKGSNAPFLLLARNVNTTRKLNADSKGDQELTEEQILSLREKYDFENLSMQDQYDLYCDLTDMGVLTAAEVESIGMSNISAKGKDVYSPPADNLFSRNQSLDFPQSSLQEWFLSLVKQEQTDYDLMLEIGETIRNDVSSKYDPSMRSAYEDFEKTRSEVDKMMAYHKRVADVLSSLGMGS